MELDDRIARAVQYPYEIPPGSFLFDAASGEAGPLADDALVTWAEGRTLVLAVGSNASPVQLARKFAGFDDDPSIPAFEVTFADHDVVYAARVASHGSIPATLGESPSTRVTVKLLALSPGQLERMNDTELLGKAYELAPVDPALVELGGVPLQDLLPGTEVWCYAATSGPLVVDGLQVAVAAIPATGRRWQALTEPEILALLAERFDASTDAFVLRLVEDKVFRQEVQERLIAESA